MIEATLEVPAKYAGGVQDQLKDFWEDALRHLARVEDGLEPDRSAEYTEGERQTRKDAGPLVEQGFKQRREGAEVFLYRGSARQLSNALDFRAGYLSDELHNVLMTGPVEYERARTLIQELEWLVGEAERVDAIDRKADAA